MWLWELRGREAEVIYPKEKSRKVPAERKTSIGGKTFLPARRSRSFSNYTSASLARAFRRAAEIIRVNLKVVMFSVEKHPTSLSVKLTESINLLTRSSTHVRNLVTIACGCYFTRPNFLLLESRPYSEYTRMNTYM